MKFCIVANKAWNLTNFRMNLMYRLLDFGIEVHAIAPADGYEKKIEQAGIPFHDWKIQRESLNPFQELQSVNAIRKIYKQVSPDLVHHFTVKALLYGTVAARMCGVKAIVNSVTGLPLILVAPKKQLHKKLAGWISMKWYGWSLTGKDTHVLLQNEDDLQLLESFAPYIRCNSSVTNGSGVPLDRFRHTSLPNNDPPHIVFVGRLIREKGIFELMSAAEQLRSSKIPFRLTLCADIDPGNRSSATSEDVQSWRDKGLFDHVGRLDDVAPCLRDADLVVLPSYREGTPRSLLEAMAIGRPIVTTDVPGCRNVVDHEVNGFLVPAQESAGLTAAMEALLEDAELRVSMGQASRHLAETVFDERTVIDQICRAYHQLAPGFIPSPDEWADNQVPVDARSDVRSAPITDTAAPL
ncbi:glycosyltransferase family 4 protein [Fuerstiella marisgermanici]|uniref:N, N'-diacetylbacillosaminyl-diphospho-undecaprenol alpha-1,3-N-acetylgalactosaminyltransferase n=1 Tax=Fuerstiella marisgermanici TaxID=1891926 RepID=A0A1P8WPF0_9PLAN|nr:glycosyltransferase family 4 protein [Fuerstiella marisgermanici]APZ95921.1 N,N'-diacetylbacillosaminyl-diphospho-undecaprenol alpha-1,3-N-acetylgalactosaminyltransferase [Fuerstiella marisgermanici]